MTELPNWIVLLLVILLVLVVAGLLGFALDQSHDDLPNHGYATVFPLATVAKIIPAQLLLVVLGA